MAPHSLYISLETVQHASGRRVLECNLYLSKPDLRLIMAHVKRVIAETPSAFGHNTFTLTVKTKHERVDARNVECPCAPTKASMRKMIDRAARTPTRDEQQTLSTLIEEMGERALDEARRAIAEAPGLIMLADEGDAWGYVGYDAVLQRFGDVRASPTGYGRDGTHQVYYRKATAWVRNGRVVPPIDMPGSCSAPESCFYEYIDPSVTTREGYYFFLGPLRGLTAAQRTWLESLGS